MVAPNGPIGPWTLAWNDEFDDSVGSSGPTNGLLNTKWNIGFFVGPAAPGDAGVQNQSTDPANPPNNGNYHGPSVVTLPGDGSVHLQGISPGPDHSGTLTDGSYTYTYECGMITTAGLMALNPQSTLLGGTLQSAVTSETVSVIDGPCVLEISFRAPGPNSDVGSEYWWPAIWFTNGGNFAGGADWPGGTGYQEEIDLWEWPGLGSGMIGSACVYHTPKPPANANPHEGASSVPPSLASVDLSLEFHTYTVEFTKSYAIIYVDGIQVFTDVSVQYQSQWDTPGYLQIALQSHAAANPPNTTAVGNNDMMVGYVRVFTQANAGTERMLTSASSHHRETHT